MIVSRNVTVSKETLFSCRWGAVLAFFACHLVLDPSHVYAANETPKVVTKPPEKPEPDPYGGDPVSMITGGVFFDLTDVAVPCPGVSLSFVRDYLSTRGAEADAPCGLGWRHNWEHKLLADYTDTAYFVANYNWMAEHNFSLIGYSGDDPFFPRREEGKLYPGDSVTVGNRTLTFDGYSETTSQNGDKMLGAFRFNVKKLAQARMRLPDGREYVFSGAKKVGGYVLADNGRYTITPQTVGDETGPIFIAPDPFLSEVGRLMDAIEESAELSWYKTETVVASGTVWDGVGTAFAFTDGALEGVTAAAGESLSLERDGGGKLVRLEHSNGLALTFLYEGSRLVRLNTPEPAFYMTYAYDVSGCVTSSLRHTSSGVFGDTYKYAESGHCLTNRMNAAGREYNYTYQSMVCKTSWLSGGYYGSEYWFASNNNISVLTESLSDTQVRRKRHEWDSSGHLKSISVIPDVVGTAAPMSEFTCSDAGDFAEEKHTSVSGDYLGLKRLYDDRYNLTNETYAVSRTPQAAEGVSYGWDDFWTLPLWRRDADGVTDSWEYDDACRLTRLLSYPSQDVPAVVGLAWSNSLPVSVTDPCGRVTAFSYDGHGHLSGVVPSVGPAFFSENDILGNPRRIIMPSPDNASNQVILVDSDEIGRNRTVTYPDGLSETLLHDACGNPTSQVSRAGRRTDVSWLPVAHVGSVKRWLDPATPATVSFDYDLLFRSLAITDPMGQTVERYVLDDEDRVVSVTNLEGQVFSAVYGAGGLTLSLNRFDGLAVSNVWDGLGNLLGVLHKAPGAAEWVPVSGFAYSAAGRTLAASNAVSRLAWAYDGAGGVTNETLSSAGGASPAVSVGWAYDASGLLTNTVVSGAGYPETLSYSASYDPGARLVSQGTLAGEFRYSYCGWNGAVAAVSNAALTVEQACDMLDRVTNIAYRAADGSLVRSFSYAFDPDGLITQKVSVAASGAAVTNAYAYDGLGRLVSADGVTYTYDLAGNRLSRCGTGDSPVLSTYTHNRLDGDGYDAAGNTISMVRNGVTLALTWNTQGQLVSVSTNGAFAESYLYDALGRRVATSDNGGTVYHVYDGDECVADVDGSGRLLRAYAWGPGIDNLLAVAVFGPGATNTYYAVKDHLGCVHALVDAQGQIVESYTYDAWGNLISGVSAVGNRYLWQGREYSFATGFYNFRARWYDPALGRWLSKDPIGLEGGVNLYEFCGSDPVNYCDPSGLIAEVLIGDAGKVTINLPIQFFGEGATKADVEEFIQCIEQVWSVKVFPYDVTVKVVKPSPGRKSNFVHIPFGNKRAYTVNRAFGVWPQMRPPWSAAHEAGHFMGLGDKYDLRTKFPYPTWRGNIMGSRGGTVDSRNIRGIIDANQPKVR